MHTFSIGIERQGGWHGEPLLSGVPAASADRVCCVSCGAALPSHLLSDAPDKIARFFAGISVRLDGKHVRVSMWVDSEARCVMSLPESEAREMAKFVISQVGKRSPTLEIPQVS